MNLILDPWRFAKLYLLASLLNSSLDILSRIEILARRFLGAIFQASNSKAYLEACKSNQAKQTSIDKQNRLGEN